MPEHVLVGLVKDGITVGAVRAPRRHKKTDPAGCYARVQLRGGQRVFRLHNGPLNGQPLHYLTWTEAGEQQPRMMLPALGWDRTGEHYCFWMQVDKEAPEDCHEPHGLIFAVRSPEHASLRLAGQELWHAHWYSEEHILPYAARRRDGYLITGTTHRGELEQTTAKLHRLVRDLGKVLHDDPKHGCPISVLGAHIRANSPDEPWFLLALRGGEIFVPGSHGDWLGVKTHRALVRYIALLLIPSEWVGAEGWCQTCNETVRVTPRSRDMLMLSCGHAAVQPAWVAERMKALD